MSRVELKKLSKSQLKGKWKVPVLLTLVYLVLSAIVGLFPGESDSLILNNIGLLVVYIIAAVETVGLPNFYLRFLETDGNAKFKDFIVDYKRLLKSFGYIVILGVLGTAVAFITILIIVITMTLGAISSVNNELWTVTLVIIIAVIVSAIIIVLYNIFLYSLKLTPYIIVENKEISLFKAMKLSKEVMKGNKWKFFILDLSFIGWGILSLFSFGIGFLWLVPYVSLCSFNFYRDLISE